MPRELYFDANATTPCSVAVQEAMRPYFSHDFANASSQHRAGKRAAMAISQARSHVAQSLGVQAAEILFTSGATESTNLVFWGLLLAQGKRKHIAISAIEHAAVADCAQLLKEQGWRVSLLPVTQAGIVDLEAAAQLITPDTALVSVQAANNEVGTIQPSKALAALAHKVGAFFHVDAVQAFGKSDLSLQDIDCDFASLSAHKIYGPKGIGALFLRGGVQAWPWPRPLRGGSQEGHLRPGTLNVPSIVGFGEACAQLQTHLPAELTALAAARDHFEAILQARLGSRLTIIGKDAPRLANTSGLLIHGLDNEFLLLQCQDICFSQGSACSAGTVGLSPVIRTLYPTLTQATFLRFSFLLGVSKQEIEQAAQTILQAIEESLL